jgi:hypothetical protein
MVRIAMFVESPVGNVTERMKAAASLRGAAKQKGHVASLLTKTAGRFRRRIP